jgi:TonB family protein
MRSPAAFFGMVLAAFVAVLLPSPAYAQTVPASSDVAALISQGDNFGTRHDYVKAMDCYEKADKLSHHACPECLFREIQVYKKAGDFNLALDCAKKAEKESGDNKIEESHALMMRATLLAATTSKPKDKKLVEAVSDTREAITLDPQDNIAHFNLGVLLIKQEQDADGIAELKTYLASNNVDPKTAKDARDDIADPRRAREPYAPDFSFTTLEKEQVSLASVRGKAVLLDFWASWCGPCRESMPTIAMLQKNFAKKDVQIIGISADDDENAWRTFVAAHHMVWSEYLDSDQHVQQAFMVDSYPTYIVLDRNGVIRFRQSGFAEGMSGAEISEALDKALKVKPEAPIAATATASPASDGAAPVASPSVSAAGQESEAPAATSAYGNPEPTYVHVPPHDTSADSGGGGSSGGAKQPFGIAIQIVTPTNGAALRPFAASISSSVTEHWLAAMPRNARTGEQGSVIVQFSVDRQGKLTGVPTVVASSDDDSLDQAALAAVSSAAPFSAVPDDFSGATVEVRLLFVYNEPIQGAVHLLAGPSNPNH